MASASRTFIVGGNWKAAANSATVKAQVERLNAAGAFPTNVEVVIAPSALHISSVTSSIRGDIGVAIQDIHSTKGLGAYTGSHAIDQVVDFGLKWILAGHSERRVIWHEKDEESAAKAKIAADAGLSTIFCVGESLAEREAGHTMDVVFRQTKALADAISKEQWGHIVLAYEPVWAIGTGKVATAEQAQEVHAALREWVAGHVSPEIALAVRIQYGGSVTAANCVGLASQADIDGFLVGGASLKAEFIDIIKAASAKAE